MKDLRLEQVSARLQDDLDVLFEPPILNIRQFEAALGVPYRTAKSYKGRKQPAFCKM